VNDISRPLRNPNPRAIALLFAALAALFAAGCRKPEPMKLHYLEDFVPGAQNVFYPAKVGVPPVGGKFAVGTFRVGGVYKADGTLERPLFVADFGALVHQSILKGLSDAGLKPVPLARRSAPGALPFGVDLMLVCDVEQVSVNKYFGSRMTVHGRYFTMDSRVKLRFTMQNRLGDTLYAGEIQGSEDEPPMPVGHEAFLPLETEPAESLSVALSRAVGGLFVEPQVRRSLPLAALAERRPSATAESSPAPPRRGAAAPANPKGLQSGANRY
jgi:hypothetical protein